MLMRIAADNVRQLLQARAESKGLMRSSNQTMVQATENNPLRFAPTVEEALAIMFGPPTASYLDARKTLEQSFRDLKTHQIGMFMAMQQALQELTADLDPKVIDSTTEAEKGVSALLGSRSARLWDIYVARWKAKTARHERGLSGVFMQYFAEAYDKPEKK
jgi:type VI secretion system protein ImpI